MSVSIEDSGSGIMRHVCTGSRLAQDIVLTAAHCVESIAPDRLFVITGTMNYLDPKGTRVSVSGFSQAGFKYQGFAARDDIALLFLSSCVGEGSTFPEIISREETNGDSPCAEVEIRAFGKSERIPSDLYVPDGKMRMLNAGQFIHSHAVCKTAFTEYILNTKFGRKYISESTKSLIDDSIPETVGCFGGESKSLQEGFTCDGDSGSPILNKATGEIIGIASFTSDLCGTLPNYFTRVSKYINWIRDEVFSRGVRCQGGVSLNYLKTTGISTKGRLLGSPPKENIEPLIQKIAESVRSECIGPYNDLNIILTSTSTITAAVSDACSKFLSCINYTLGTASTEMANKLLEAFPSNLDGSELIHPDTRKAIGRVLLCTSSIELYFESVRNEAEINANYMDNAPANTECNR